MGPDKVTRSVERSLEARMRSVAYAAMAYWYYEWDWGEAIAFDGIDETAEAFRDDHLRSFVDAGVTRWASLEPSESLTNRMGPIGCALRRLEGDASAWQHLERSVRAFHRAVATAPRSPEDAFLLDEPSPMIFVDTLYAEPAALAGIGDVTDSAEARRTAVDLCLGHIRHLQDDRTGLFRHYCDTSTMASPPILWGRGNGWALLGLAETIATLGSSTPDGLPELIASFRRACEAALETVVPGGGWRNIMDDEASAMEASTSAMIATALLIGIRCDVLERSRFLPTARATWKALEHRVDAGGHFVGVSFRPGLNTDPSRYEHVPFSGNLPWGQGAYLRLAAEWRRHEPTSP